MRPLGSSSRNGESGGSGSSTSGSGVDAYPLPPKKRHRAFDASASDNRTTGSSDLSAPGSSPSGSGDSSPLTPGELSANGMSTLARWYALAKTSSSKSP